MQLGGQPAWIVLKSHSLNLDENKLLVYDIFYCLCFFCSKLERFYWQQEPRSNYHQFTTKTAQGGFFFTVALQEAILPKGILFSYSEKGRTFPESCDIASMASSSSMIKNWFVRQVQRHYAATFHFGGHGIWHSVVPKSNTALDGSGGDSEDGRR